MGKDTDVLQTLIESNRTLAQCVKHAQAEAIKYKISYQRLNLVISFLKKLSKVENGLMN